MVHRDERVAGVVAVCTAALLGLSLWISQPAPRWGRFHDIMEWYAAHGPRVRIGALTWLVAMLLLVVFAVRLRDALRGLSVDRWWLGDVFVQGATVFAVVVVIAAAAEWTLAELAGRSMEHGESCVAMWSLHRTLVRFSSWGMSVPILTAGFTLWRFSTFGRVTAVFGAVAAATLLVTPPIWRFGQVAAMCWLVLTGLVLLRPQFEDAPSRQAVPPAP